MTKLPDLPSELITLALADLEKVEQMPEYKVDMNHWHIAFRIDETQIVCAVCLAGSVMAMTLEAPLDTVTRKEIFPGDFDCDTAGKLGALNGFRKGNLAGAFHRLDLGDGPIVDTASGRRMAESGASVTPYEEDPDQFKSDMRGLAELLASHGL